MRLLYPSDPLRKRLPDEFYAEECEAARAAGIETSVFSFEDFQEGAFKPSPLLSPEDVVVYRGWMLTPEDYARLTASVEKAGARMLTDARAYRLAHHLPGWYPLIPEFTPETKVFPAEADLAVELQALGWPAYFIKDYVKSLKTSGGSIISGPERAAALVAEMRRYRGVIEGGFCVRRVENFVPGTERRHFVIRSTPHAPEGVAPSIVLECAKRIQSPFFSVDVAKRADGELRVVEVGDGQVSDRTGWSAERFVAILNNAGLDG